MFIILHIHKIELCVYILDIVLYVYTHTHTHTHMLPGGIVVKNSPANAGDG